MARSGPCARTLRRYCRAAEATSMQTPGGSAVKSVFLMKGSTMSKKRLIHAAVVAAMLTALTVLAATTANARPARTHGTVKLGFITKFPVDFYFTLVKAAK